MSFTALGMAVLSSSTVWGQASRAPAVLPATSRPLPPRVLPKLNTLPKLPEKLPHRGAPVIPAAEPVASVPLSAIGPRALLVAPLVGGTVLTGPASETDAGSSNALSITNTGSNRGISVSNSATSNASSALYGETYGAGAGLTGFNYGASGPGGKFQVMNANSSQAGAFASTAGVGPAVLGTVTNNDNGSPAVYGQNNAGQAYGIGVEGDGSEYGVYGTSPLYAVFGNSDSGVGVFGSASSGYAVYGGSSTGVGIDGTTNSSSTSAVQGSNATGTAVYGVSDGFGAGVYGSSQSDYGVLGSSTTSVGVYGFTASTSTDSIGVYAFSGSGEALFANAEGPSSIGLYAYSDTGTALNVSGGGEGGTAAFQGAIAATAYDKVSDRNAKRDFAPVDRRKLLKKIEALRVSTWNATSDQTERRHFGPTPQDFKAMFHLDGDDDERVSLSDLLGVNLAAIQALRDELIEKDKELAQLEAERDRQIADLQSQLMAVSQRVALIERQQGVPLQSAYSTQ